VLTLARPAAVVAVLARTDARWIVATILLVVVDRGLMAYRWILLLCPLDPAARPPLASLLRLFFTSTFAGTFLPASVGGDLVRAYGLSQLRVAAGQAVASVVMDRLLGVISILIAGGVGLLLAQKGDLASTRVIVAAMTGTAFLSLVAGSVVFSERAAALAERIALALPFAPIRRIAADLARATRAYGRYHRELGLVLAASLGVQALRIVQAYGLGRALLIPATFDVYVTFIPLILLIMLLPFTINGIGTSQAAFVWFFGRVGISQADAFALSVLFVALGIVGNLPGGLLYALGPRIAPRTR
jgi:uncharacterized protein (TIRG00374 family)